MSSLATNRAGIGADRRIVLGNARSLALLLSLDVAAIRLAFVGMALAAPPLMLLYALAGLLASGLRQSSLPPRLAGVDPSSRVGIVGLLAAEIGVLLLARNAGLALPDPLPFAVLTVQAFLTLGWRRIEAGGRWGWIARVGEGRITSSRASRLMGVFRLAIGIGLVLWAIYLLLRQQPFGNDVVVSLSVLLSLTLLIVGLALLLIPPVLRLGSQFNSERRERIRADERAKLATHLHDSVLQTLTLIQRHSDDPADVATLARSQERELRDWLYGGVASADAGRLRDRLAALAAEIETRYRWRVELIVVGDADVDARAEELLAATREAMVNAARHSQAARCDVYAECRPDGIQIFVRDRGIGFDQTSIPEDRRGLADSVVSRMQRVGGTAAVRSTGETGTEVELELPTRVPA